MATLQDLYQAIGGQWLPAPPPSETVMRPLGRVCIDSRRLEPGEVFWALRGPHHDGADFTAEAFARGAVGAVVGHTPRARANRWILQVEDPQQALWRWAACCRRQFSGTMIAVTGSVGKTTTRQMIHTLLATRFRGTASPRNYNNHVGLPLSLLGVAPEHDYAVLELGASRRGEIAALADLCRPQVGVITRIAEAHMAEFGSRRAIAQAKAELLDALPPQGHAVLGNDPQLRALVQGCRAGITWIGDSRDCDLAATEVEHRRGLLEFHVAGCPFVVPVWGRHHVTAALAAIAVGRLMGLDFEEMAAALRSYETVPMRCQVLAIRGATIINDAYNSNPTAMRAALELLQDFDTPGRRIVVCGDMAELGQETAILHWQLGQQIATICRADLLIACGEYARHVVAAARSAGMTPGRTITCARVDDALPYLGQAITPGDVVLVKGSRVMGMERIVEALEQYPLRRSA
jgi:UDP-N-acetylmuramoyl-tripeptide--D-alanyl-D-alanine ligase